MARHAATAIFWIVGLSYGFGAFVHLTNILGFNGYDWLDAPLKWQVLDVVYLILDLLVAAGLLARSRLAIAAFYVAAVSQILLYTIFRAWVVDVPESFGVFPELQSYLFILVVFHLIAIVLMTGALRITHTTRPSQS